MNKINFCINKKKKINYIGKESGIFLAANVKISNRD